MRKLKQILRSTMLYVSAIVLVGASPMVAYAEDEPEKFTHDKSTGRWNSNKWVFDKAANKYVPAPSPTSSPPPSSAPTAEENDDETSTESTTAAASPAGGNATVDDTVDASVDTDIDNDTDVKNGINSDSKTGDAEVKANTKAGDAKSGNAKADATIINSVHSTVDGETSGIAEFTIDIYGDVVGDITIGPAIKNAEVNRDINLNSDTNIDNDTVLTNDVKLSAKSGNATVDKNTEAGSATSGNADAVANVLNLINTVVAANKSFVGTINIHGNLNGDILVSPEFIPQLLADNSISRFELDMPLELNMNNDQDIVNNVNLNATTGDATVKDNTGAGNAKTGTAQTKLTVLNLTGHKVDAKNSLLVFVNVLGKWVGMIVDAPGATSAALGSGVVNHDITVSDTTNINNKGKIINNLDLSAESGDASVTSNTKAGDATSGDATASANIANISTSEFQLTDWFGVLFINVFGTWIGSFGIDTEAGTVVPLSGAPHNAKSKGPNLQFGFMPKKEDNDKLTSLAVATTTGEPVDNIKEKLADVISSVGAIVPNAPESKPAKKSQQLDPVSAAMMVGGFMLAGASSAWMKIRRRLEARHSKDEVGLTIPQ